MVVIEAFAQSHALCILGILAHVHVVPARGMFQQVDHAHRVSGFPAIFKPDLRHKLTHRVLKGKLAFVHQLEDGKRGKGLGCRADTKQCLVGRGVICCHIGLAEACDPFGTIAMHNGHGHTRRMRVLEDFLQLLAKFGNRLCRFGLVACLVLSRAGCGKQTKQNRASDGLHAEPPHHLGAGPFR